MQFFTDEKYQKRVAHSEYEKYWQENRERLGDELLRINGGMLPTHCFPDLMQVIELHDARIRQFTRDEVSLELLLHGDNHGDLRVIQLRYDDLVDYHGMTPLILGNVPESDLMCHETTVDVEGVYCHEMLFASGEIVFVRFRRFAVLVNDDGTGVFSPRN